MKANQVPHRRRRRRLHEALASIRRRLDADEAVAQLNGWTLRRHGRAVVVRDPRFDRLTPDEIDRIADFIGARRWL
jgi:hypothetical protein